MLFGRFYEAAEDAVLYHYCTAETFHAICSGKKIRFSDLFSMNDFMEMHWGYQIWEEVATELKDEYGLEFIDAIDIILHQSGMKGLPLASCFSLSGDILSQWRAYGANGNGYAIGFSASCLTQLPVRPLRVLYDKEEQIKELRAVIKSLHTVESSRGHVMDSDFFEVVVRIAFDLASFKNPAFSEENEVRMIHLLNFVESNKSLRLVDPGGIAYNSSHPSQTVNFFIRDSAPVTYIDIDFTCEGKISPIKEVIIGPRNNVRKTAISVYLETIGIPNVEVKKSAASYR